MALFRRNKTENTNVPPEVTDYYQAENRERAWVAWMLAAGTLLITVIIVLGLFYGGRWTYRKLHKSKAAPVVVQTHPAASQSAPATPPPNSKPATPPTPAPQTSSTNTAAPTTSTNTAATNATSSANLPNTGPGDTVAVFLAVSMLAYALHRRFIAE